MTILRAILALAALATQVLPAPTKAAEIVLRGTPEMHCFATLRGQIVPGDADKLESIIKARLGERGSRLCLDSPGGSMIEGVKLAQLLIGFRMGTAIPKGARCESACALAFMGGRRNDENDRGDHPDRKLHPLGKLGFHATALTVPEGQYTEATVTKAYNLASQGLSEILLMMTADEFPRSLLIDMLATPNNQMMYVDTLSKAARWNIDIYPTISPEKLTVLAMLNACEYGQMRFFDENREFASSGPNETPTLKTRLGENDQVWSYEGVWESGYRQERATGCEINYTLHMPGWEDPLLRQVVWVSMGDHYEDFPPFVLFPPSTPLSELARSEEGKVEFQPLARQQTSLTFYGRCFVFKFDDSGGNLVDDDLCKMDRRLTIGHNLERSRLETFTWPSGAKTVIENDRIINGHAVAKFNDQEARNWLVKHKFFDNNQMYRYSDCWRNSKSRNLFCFFHAPSILADEKLQASWYQTRLF